MSNRPSLAMQLGALRHCVAYAGSQGIGDEVVRNAEAGIASMTFLRDHRDAFVALMSVLQAFPDAELEGAENVGEADELEHVRGFYVPGGMVDGGET
jgi:hypothetical protein